MQNTGVTIPKFRAGATNSDPNERADITFSVLCKSHLWMTPVLTYYHLTAFLDRRRENKHAYQLTLTRFRLASSTC